MQAEIITIGDEILIGQIVDSNSAFIGKEFNKVGISVYQITSVQDNKTQILEALNLAVSRSQLVILTGGLGPTKDDITKATLCEFTEDYLVEDAEVLKHVEKLLEKYRVKVFDMNKRQALVPSKAIVLPNHYGTAPGLWLKKNNTVLVSLPGVPFEMKNLISNYVIPKAIKAFERPYILHKTVMTYGWGESTIADTIKDWENNLPEFIKLAYLPSLGRVRLRLSAKGFDKMEIENAVNEEVKKLYPLIGEIIHGEGEEETLEAQLGKILAQKEMTLATAESFTGGKIAERLTAIPGASKYFKGAVVSYATETKIKLLGVPIEIIDANSVVSEAVAVAMAKNAKRILDTDFAIATTGNAGPTKGDSDVEVGTVYIAISTPSQTFAKKFQLGNHRELVAQRAVNKAFELLQKEILNF